MQLIVGTLEYPLEQADKKARAEKAAKEKALREGEQPPQAAASSGPAIGGAASIAAAAGSGLKGKDYPDTRLQVGQDIKRWNCSKADLRPPDLGAHLQTDQVVDWRRSVDQDFALR